jgi:hypothetical protein
MLKKAFFYSIFITSMQARGAQDLTVVDKARERLVERDRAGAAQLLIAAINSEKNGDTKIKLLKELKRANTLFFTEEGQRAYELGESVRYSGQEGYLKKYEEAEKSEAGNESVSIGLALAHLSLKNCKKAAAIIEAAKILNPFRSELKILAARAELCNETIGAQEAIAEAETSIEKEFLLYKESISCQRAAIENKIEATLRHAKEVQKIDVNYPQSYYWVWRVQKNQENMGREDAQKYLSLCKNVQPPLRRKYFLEPQLCADVESVAEFVKKLEVQ